MSDTTAVHVVMATAVAEDPCDFLVATVVVAAAAGEVVCGIGH